MQKPDVDQIDGLSPAISIEQKTTLEEPAPRSAPSPRSTTTCACWWARVGVLPYCPQTGLPIGVRSSRRWSTAYWRCLRAPAFICSPAVRGRKRGFTRVFRRTAWQRQRAKIDGVHELAEAPTLDKKSHDIDVVVDRIGAPGPASAWRKAETALKLAEGLAVIEYADEARGGGRRRKELTRRPQRSTTRAGRNDPVFRKVRLPGLPGFTIPEIEPRLFSFNNPYGACPVCGGLE